MSNSGELIRLAALALLLTSTFIIECKPTAATTLSPDKLEIHFDSLSASEGLTLTVSARGDTDARTTFSNMPCCGLKSALKFIKDVRITADGRPLAVTLGPKGWTVKHAPGALLQVSYRLPHSGPMMIDIGAPDQLRPIVTATTFHMVGTFGLLLPTGRSDSEPLLLYVDATQVADNQHFVSSFGAGNRLHGVRTTWSQAAKALYLGGAITLSIHDTSAGKVAIAYSGMSPGFDATDFSMDALQILAGERDFFHDSQPWYLVSLHGGVRKDHAINLGGGMGLSNSFVMFARSDLDAANPEHREQFRWVLAHEYFHNWNGLTLRVASAPRANSDDASVYWFSEGVTEFYTMRILTRIGLQSPDRSLRVLDYKLERYAANRRRQLSAAAAAGLFWSDPDGEQIPYLRGYLAAWVADLGMQRGSGNQQDLDSALRSLLTRARREPGFRVDNTFLADYLSKAMSAKDRTAFRKFVLEGGDAPLDERSFAPCLVGKRSAIAGISTLQFEFSDPSMPNCFRH